MSEDEKREIKHVLETIKKINDKVPQTESDLEFFWTKVNKILTKYFTT